LNVGFGENLGIFPQIHVLRLDDPLKLRFPDMTPLLPGKWARAWKEGRDSRVSFILLPEDYSRKEFSFDRHTPDILEPLFQKRVSKAPPGYNFLDADSRF
jgi:hypothetical protein